mgnify:CR=1 FL=1
MAAAVENEAKESVMKVLIAGANGNIGRHLIQRIAKDEPLTTRAIVPDPAQPPAPPDPPPPPPPPRPGSAAPAP